MVIAKYLEVILMFSYEIFHYVIHLDRDWLICIDGVVVFAMTAWAVELSFLG